MTSGNDHSRAYKYRYACYKQVLARKGFQTVPNAGLSKPLTSWSVGSACIAPSVVVKALLKTYMSFLRQIDRMEYANFSTQFLNKDERKHTAYDIV